MGSGCGQNHIERILAGWVRELRVPIDYGSEVDRFRAGRHRRRRRVVRRAVAAGAISSLGATEGRSLIRKAAGIEFAGWDPTTSSLLAEVEMAEQPELGIYRTAFGVHSFGRVDYEIRDGEIIYADKGPIGVLVTEKDVGATSEATLRDLSEALIAVCGTDYGIHNPTWISRFTDMTRQAAAYRDRRVLLPATRHMSMPRTVGRASRPVCRMR